MTAGTTTGRRAVVVGGGIAGLCAAFEFVRAGWTVEVHEASSRWGGKIASSPVGDRLVDAGPDTFLARVEPGVELCRDLGLDDELTSPVAPVPAYIVRHHHLHRLPPGSMLGVPTDLTALEGSGLVSAEGVARAAADLTAPATPIDGDLSVGELCRARLGDEVTDRLIDPLLGGINASDLDRLSLMAGAPLLATALQHSPSLIEGLRRVRPSTGPTLGTAGGQPVFYGLPGGIARLIDVLVETLGRAGNDSVRLMLDSPVSSLAEIDPSADGGADAVVIATPAFAAAPLLAEVSPPAAEELAAIDYAAVSQVTVELDRQQLEAEPDASGILFPRVDGTILTACTWFSTKWAHYRRPGTVLVRLTSGRYGDDRAAALDDDELTETLLSELGTVVAIEGRPRTTRVVRWPRSFPQYAPGHKARIDRAEAALVTDAPRIRLAGAAYRGIGIPACIDSGRSTARSLIEVDA